MRIDVITLFPELITTPLGTSIMGRAREKQLVDLHVHNLRERGLGRHKQVDDTPYGGGQGMVLRPEPIFETLDTIDRSQARTILMTPQGKRFSQADARRLSEEKHLVFLCGHYEGVDHRVVEHAVDEELSIGDYVLTNGAIAAVVVIDAIVRLLPGALGDEQSAVEESFSDPNLLEGPQYTKPAEYRGYQVPEILLSGHHGKIAEWRKEQALARTKTNRPDLLD
ncbi:MAG: tRNA (guanosine(37)-N1)-methyltransferase TrmD [Verrucomicrobiaceae bacterium]|nr:tRNA (guanosine(37)-N1)-methyltransferase TrmD [Verrucomicrobiaceae bacterium]